MAIRIKPAARVRKTKSIDSQEVLARLQEFLEQDAGQGQLVQVISGFWKDQRNVISYQELRQVVLDQTVSKEMLKLWTQDYSRLVANTFSGKWMEAAAAGAARQPLLQNSPFEFNMQHPGALGWLKRHGGEFVTSCVDEQRKAIAALVTKKMVDGHTVDELSRLIRPCIGLTEQQAKANARYYDNIVTSLKKDHPRMKEENIQKKAREAAQKYAEKQHRYRAMTIAQTESAFAYNWGMDEGIRQAQAQGLIGEVRKEWSTSGDDGVCPICSALDGMEIDMDDDFPIKLKAVFQGQHRLPPAHPRCGCGIKYIEVSPPVSSGIPQVKVDITQADSFREYSKDEIEDIARQTEEAASRHVSVPSKWSGKMVVDDEGIQNSDGHITHYGKLWECDILTAHSTAPSIIMHEQMHARSISHYGQNAYFSFQYIEEAAVQLMTEEVCRQEGIEIIGSDYYPLVEALKRIGRYISKHKTDYDFAKFMIEMPVVERLQWISEQLYDTLGNDIGATVEDYQNFADLLNMLYTKE